MGLAAGISFARHVIVARLLDPETFGVLALVMLGAAYFSYLWTWGTHEALLKETASAVSSSDEPSPLTGGVLVFTVTIFLAVSVVWTAAGGLLFWDSPHLVLVFAIPTYSFALSMSALSMIAFRARRQHLRFAGFLAVRNGLATAASVTGAAIAPSVIAPAAGDALAYAAVAVVALRATWNPGAFFRQISTRFRMGRGLVKRGLPYSLMALLRNIGLNIDNWAVLAFRSALELGLYSLTMLLLALAGVLNNLIGVRLQPELLGRLADGESPRALFQEVTRLALKILGGLLLVAVPATFLLRGAIDRFLPLYDAIGPALIGLTLLGVAFEVANVFDVAALPFGIAYRGTFVYGLSAVIVLCGCLACGLLDAPLWSFALVFASGRMVNMVGTFFTIRSRLVV